MKIRIGNDVKFNWSIVDASGVPVSFAGVSNMVLCVITPHSIIEVQSYSIYDNTLVFQYIAAEQQYTGTYSLRLTFTREDATVEGGIATFTIDYRNAFTLVPHTALADNVSGVNIEGALDRVLGVKGDPFLFSDFTAEQISLLQQPAIEAAELANTAREEAEEAENVRAAAETARETLKSELVTIKAETTIAKDNANAAATNANSAAATCNAIATQLNNQYYKPKLFSVAGLFHTNASNANVKFALANYDWSLITSYSMLFANCYIITYIPPTLETSNSTYFSYMALNCKEITTFPSLDMSKAKSIAGICNGCTKLHTVNNLNISSVYLEENYPCFVGCTALENCQLTGLKTTMSFADSPLLSRDSILFIFNNAQNLTELGIPTKIITLHATAKARLSNEDIAIATAKGFSVV